MHSQPSSSENAMNGQSPTSTSDTDIPMSGGSVASQQQHPRPGSGPPPAHMGHMMMPPNFRGMMPHYVRLCAGLLQFSFLWCLDVWPRVSGLSAELQHDQSAISISRQS